MQRLLLDTHVVLWWLQDSPLLGTTAHEAIEEPDNWVAVSSASAFEIAIKKKLGKLGAPDDLEEQLDTNAFEKLPVTFAHGLAAGALPLHHRDPFDRLLIAQARIDDLALVTADQQIRSYDVSILPATE